MSVDFTYARTLAATAMAGRRLCTVEVRRAPGDPVLNPSTLVAEVVEGALVYSGPARIWSVNASGNTNLGDAGSHPLRSTQVDLPETATRIQVDDVVKVVACPYDADLVGRSAVVTGVDGGGILRGSRRLNVTSLYEDKHWDGT
jgi:hypothetical protein